MKKSTKRFGGVAAMSITALAVAAGASVAAEGPQHHASADLSTKADLFQTSYKEADGSVRVWLKEVAGGVDLKLIDANGTMDKFIKGETLQGADAFYKFIKLDSADYFLKFHDGSSLDFMFKGDQGRGVTTAITPGGTDSNRTS